MAKSNKKTTVNKVAKRAPRKHTSEAAKIIHKTSRRKYRKHFLDRVMARVDFTPDFELKPSNPPSLLSPSNKRRFPNKQQQLINEQQFEVKHTDPQTTQTTTKQTQQIIWQFLDKNKTRIITIGKDHISIKYTKYDSYERLLKDLIPPIEQLSKLHEFQVRRIGLRYIDQIVLDERNQTEWSKYLTPNTLSIFNLADDVKTMGVTRLPLCCYVPV